MKSKVNRRINRQPIRSPSPDIANRSIIKETSSPIYDALKKSRTISQSIVNHDQGVQQMKQALSQWENKCRIMKEQLNYLLLQNSDLKRQVHHLNEEISKRSQQVHIYNDQQNSRDQIRQYESKFDLLMQQIHRIQGLLQQQKANNDLLNRQIEFLKNNPMKNARNIQNIYPEDITIKRLNQIQQYLNKQMENTKKNIDLKSNQLISGLEDRLNHIEQFYIKIENRLKQQQFSTPKINKDIKMVQSTAPGNRSSLSGQVKKIGRRTILTNDDKRQLEEQLKDQQQEIDRLILDNKTLQLQLQHQKQKAYIRKDTECSKCKIYLRQIEQLQQQIQRLKGQHTDKKHDKQQTQMGQIEHHNKSFESNIGDYLQKIKGIKSILSNQQFRQFVNRINELINENTKLHSKVDKLLINLEKLNKEAKAKDIEKVLLLNELNQQNEILKTKIKQQNIQISKLQQLLEQKYHYERQQDEEESPKQIEGQQGTIFRRYIQEAIKRLQNLEQTMQSTLQQ